MTNDKFQMTNKLNKLKYILKDLKSVVVAYSGGVDSTFLLKMCLDTLGRNNVLAVTAQSPTYPQKEYKFAKNIAKELNADFITIKTNELKDKNFVKNPRERCYYCKKELFGKLDAIAKKRDKAYVIDGTNKDDSNDYRPGARAKTEFGVRSPLAEAEFTKKDIRIASKKIGLSTWDKPNLACLASRFAYGEEIIPRKLKSIDSAEDFLRKQGFKQVRVRLHDSIARIEVEPLQVKKLLNGTLRNSVLRQLKRLGFTYVTVDLQGYRTGSMNESPRISP